MEKDPLLSEVLALSLGNMSPHSECEIEISWVEELCVWRECKVHIPLPMLEFGTQATVHVVMPRPMLALVASCESIFLDTDKLSLTECNCRTYTSSKEQLTVEPFVDVSLEPGLPFLITSVNNPVSGISVVQAVFSSWLAPTTARYVDSGVEIVCIIDCSGSMRDEKIAQARNALQLLLSSLPIGCYFNVLKFGSSFVSMFDISTQYVQSSLNTARQFCLAVDATMGGTELLPPLKFVLDGQHYEDTPCQLFVITDGQVDNRAEILSYVLSRCKNSGTRVFSVGIGSDVDRDLVSGIAAAAHGYATFITNEDGIEAAVLSQLCAALGTITHRISVNWEDLHPHQLFPNMLPSATVEGNTIVQYGVCPLLSSDAAVQVSTMHLPQTSICPTSFQSQKYFEILAAVHEIASLHEVQAIVELATRFNLVSQHTSLVAVDIRNSATLSSMQKVIIGSHVSPVSTLAPASGTSNYAGSKKGNWTSINGVLCKIQDVSMSKTGKHGHAKVHVVAIDPVTGKKLEQLSTGAASSPDVEITFPKYTLVDSEEGVITVMQDNGDSVEISVQTTVSTQVHNSFSSTTDPAGKNTS